MQHWCWIDDTIGKSLALYKANPKFNLIILEMPLFSPLGVIPEYRDIICHVCPKHHYVSPKQKPKKN